MAVVGDVMRDDHGRQRPRLLDRDALFPDHRRLLRDVARHALLRLRDPAVVLLHQARRLVGVEVADDRERGVGGHVVAAIERADVVDGGRLEVLHAADDRMLVGMHGERGVVQQLRQAAVWLVLDAHPAFFLDDLALALERVLVDAQRGHPIGLEPQHQRQVLRWRRLPVDRDVLTRLGVGLPADAGDERAVRFRLHVLRALEHHVLEQVREAGAPRLLVLRPDVVPQLHVHDRRGVILRENHREAVGERRDPVVELRRRHGGGHDDRIDRDPRSREGEHDVGRTTAGQPQAHGSIMTGTLEECRVNSDD